MKLFQSRAGKNSARSVSSGNQTGNPDRLGHPTRTDNPKKTRSTHYLRPTIAAATAATLAAALMVGAAATPATADAATGVVEFTAPGSRTLTLPDGVQTLLAQGIGGGGAGGYKLGDSNGAAGGVGADVKASIDVSNTDSLNINVAAGGAIGSGGSDGAGRGGEASTITDNTGNIGFVAGGGGGGSTGYAGRGNNGSGNKGGDAGAGNNGTGHSGDGNAGGDGGSKGTPGKGGDCNKCQTPGNPGQATTGGVGAAGTSTSGQGGYGGSGYGGGGGGGLAPSTTGISITTKSNGGGGAGGSRADGSWVQSKFTSINKSADNAYGTAGAAGGNAAPTAGNGGKIKFDWLLQPTNLHVEPGNGQVTVTWSEPNQSVVVADANLADPNYEVYVNGQASGKNDAGGSVITGLQNGQKYAISVVVSSQAKSGTKFPLATQSDIVNAGPASAPGAAGTPSATSWGIAAGDNGYVNLKWTAPSNNGGAVVTGYQVQQQSVGGGNYWFASQNCTAPTATSCQVQGLVPDVGYVFRVRAVNAIGSGVWSAQSVTITPRYQPPAPKNQAPVKNCAKYPKNIRLKNKTYALLAPNCKTNAGQVVKVKVQGKLKVGKKVTYAIYKPGKGKLKNYTVIRTYNVKVNLKITWFAAAKARPAGNPMGPAYKAWSTSKSYKVR